VSEGLPIGWATTTLGEVCSKPQYGWTSAATKAGGIRYVRTTDISGGKIDWESVPYCAHTPDDLKKYRLRENDILVSRAGSVGVSYRVAEAPDDAVFASYLIRFKPLDSIEPKYIELFLKSDDYWRSISEFSAGIAVPNVNASKLASLELPLAPLAEQRRIVTKLEELLGKVDSSQQRLAKIPVLLKRFRQSVLAAACSGRLTANWREEHDNGESSVQLLRSFDAKPLAKGDDDVPETWCWGKFGELVTNHDGQRIPVKQSDRDKRSGPYPYYGAFGVIDDIDEYLYDGDYLLLAEDGKNLESRLRPISLIASGKFWVNNHAHVLQAKGGIPLRFLNAWLNSPTLDLSPFLTGIDQVKLNRAAMDRIPVPIAPFPEQQEIVRRVEALFALADQLEARYAKARAHVEKLTQSILAKAFRGELVPQDPTDEPASMLLERIKRTHKPSNTR
jgi:type I restriction enzyme S subunit